jgi:hypothetical protein
MRTRKIIYYYEGESLAPERALPLINTVSVIGKALEPRPNSKLSTLYKDKGSTKRGEGAVVLIEKPGEKIFSIIDRIKKSTDYFVILVASNLLEARLLKSLPDRDRFTIVSSNGRDVFFSYKKALEELKNSVKRREIRRT